MSKLHCLESAGSITLDIMLSLAGTFSLVVRGHLRMACWYRLTTELMGAASANWWEKGRGWFFKQLYCVTSHWVVHTLGCLHTGLSAHWAVHTLGRPHTGLSAHWVTHTLSCPHTGLSTHWVTHTLGCPHTGSSMHWVVHTLGCPHTGLPTH